MVGGYCVVLCLRAGPEQAGKEAWFAMKESGDREREETVKGKQMWNE